MAEQMILLTLQDRDPLRVPKKLLTENSNVFRRIIVDLGFDEHEMVDFSADVVTHFIKLLEKPETAEISNSKFRELHKMAVVFEVGWLKDRCRKWLIEKITDDIILEEKLFIFEECLFVLRKWCDSSLMDTLVARLALNDNTAFIAQSTMDFDKLDTLHLQLMLKLGGSNTTVFMEMILRSLSNEQSLHQNTRFLLERLNLPLCLAQDEELYDNMFTSILDLRELTRSDSRIISMLLLEASKKVHLIRTTSSSSSETTAVFDDRKWDDLVKCSDKLANVIQAITQHNVSSVFIVVDMLILLFVVNPPSVEETERLSTTLIDTCSDNNLQKISSQYLDMIISALKISHLPQKDQLITMLEAINNEKKLSCDKNVVISTQEKVARKSNSSKDRTYVFKHPGVACSRSGRCGFKLKHCKQKNNDWTIVLCTNDADYQGTDIHYHDIVSLDRMYHYGLVSGTTDAGQKVKVPARFGWWTKWLPGLKDVTVARQCIQYNLTGYLVDKHD